VHTRTESRFAPVSSCTHTAFVVACVRACVCVCVCARARAPVYLQTPNSDVWLLKRHNDGQMLVVKLPKGGPYPAMHEASILRKLSGVPYVVQLETDGMFKLAGYVRPGLVLSFAGTIPTPGLLPCYGHPSIYLPTHLDNCVRPRRIPARVRCQVAPLCPSALVSTHITRFLLVSVVALHRR
jgi:hypothetical protein